MLDNHLATCDFSMIPCPNKCCDDLFGDLDTLQLMRKDLETHMKKDCPNREHECGLCGQQGKYFEMKWFHHETCPEKIVPCPNRCGITMKRQHTKEHITTECELTMISCKYKRIGCEMMLKRGDMAAHEEDDKLHLHMAIDTTTSLKTELEEALKRVSILEIRQKKVIKHLIDQQQAAQPVTIKMTGFDAKRLNSTRFVSPSFYSTSASHGYNVCVAVDSNGLGDGAGTHVAIHFCLRKGGSDNLLDWPFAGDVTFTLVNQLEDRNHFSMSFSIKAEQNFLVGGSYGYK